MLWWLWTVDGAETMRIERVRGDRAGLAEMCTSINQGSCVGGRTNLQWAEDMLMRQTFSTRTEGLNCVTRVY